MNSLVRIILFVALGFGLICAGVVGYREFELHRVHSESVRKGQEAVRAMKQARALQDDVLAKIREAEKIADPYQRCLQFPNPPGVQWDKKVVEDLCRVSALPITTIAEISDKLAHGDVAAVDAMFDQYADQSVSDPQRHGLVMAAYRALFFTTDARAGAAIDEWLKLAPKSANALAARGVYRERAAIEARGTQAFAETPREDIDEMERLGDLAKKDLKASLQINPHRVVPATFLILIAQTSDGQETVEAAGARAVAIDPTELHAYLFWALAVAPMWGGSLESVHRIAEAAKAYRDANPRLAVVDARAAWIDLRSDRREHGDSDYAALVAIAPDWYVLDEGSRLARDGDKRLIYVSQLVRFQPSPETYMKRARFLSETRYKDWAAEDAAAAVASSAFATAEPIDLAQALRMSGNLQGAADLLTKVLEQKPKNVRAMINLVRIHHQLKRDDQAQAVAERMIAAYPTEVTGWMLLADVTKDRNPTKYCEAMATYMGMSGMADKDWDVEGKCAIKKPATAGTTTP